MTDSKLVTRPAPEEAISQTVVRAVADAKDVQPMDLDERVYDCVDPDALDALFSPTGQGLTRDGLVVFSMAGCRVEIESDRVVFVTPPQADAVKSEARA